MTKYILIIFLVCSLVGCSDMRDSMIRDKVTKDLTADTQNFTINRVDINVNWLNNLDSPDEVLVGLTEMDRIMYPHGYKLKERLQDHQVWEKQ